MAPLPRNIGGIPPFDPQQTRHIVYTLARFCISICMNSVIEKAHA
jgi:hypothetical protein